jgi:hypothetical protein
VKVTAANGMVIFFNQLEIFGFTLNLTETSNLLSTY